MILIFNVCLYALFSIFMLSFGFLIRACYMALQLGKLFSFSLSRSQRMPFTIRNLAQFVVSFRWLWSVLKSFISLWRFKQKLYCLYVVLWWVFPVFMELCGMSHSALKNTFIEDQRELRFQRQSMLRKQRYLQYLTISRHLKRNTVCISPLYKC